MSEGNDQIKSLLFFPYYIQRYFASGFTFITFTYFYKL